MARLVYWNVEHFSSDKFFGRRRRRLRDDNDDYDNPRSEQLRDFLVNTIRNNDPDIISIIEVRPGDINRQPGQVIIDEGSLNLLHRLREVTGNSWHLVPPLMLGEGHKGEGIAVYYRSDRFHFTGPWRFPGGADGIAGSPTTIGNNALGFYDEPWRRLGRGGPLSALPARQVPNNMNILNNRGRRENQLAGQWRFRGNIGGGAGVQILRFPGPANDYRTPFLTTFFEIANNRNISLLSFHAPPDQLLAPTPESVGGTRRISFIEEFQAIQNTEVQLIVGDFNISIFDANSVNQGYGRIVNTLNFTRLINATADQFPDKGYVCTHIQGVGGAIDELAAPWNTNGYPGFGYVSVPSQFGTYDSIDNAFRKYAGGVVPPASNITIVNRVTGSPYNAALAPPPGVPQGHYAYPHALRNPASLDSPHGKDPNAADAQDVLADFRDILNYARIRDTSDHLPLIFDF